MADIKFAIAVLKNRIAYPIRAVPNDPAHNALRRLGSARSGSAIDPDDQEWFDSALQLLTEQTASQPHEESEGNPGAPPPLVEANATPWYAVFEDHEGDIWAARFFGPNLPGKWEPHGVHIVDQDPVAIDADMVGDATLSARSMIMVTRADFGDDTTAQHDHGGGGGVIRTDW